MTTDGVAVAVNLNREGQNARYTFAGTSGQTLRLNVSALATTPSGRSVSYSIRDPNGTSVGATFSVGPTLSYDIPALPPLSGSYTVFVNPSDAVTATMNMSISPR